MTDLLKKALALSDSERYFMAIKLLASLEDNIVQANQLSAAQLAELHLAKAEIDAGESSLLTRAELRDEIDRLRQARKKAS
ncbi:MAG: addiction module protein [Bacteroidota bacterium]